MTDTATRPAASPADEHMRPLFTRVDAATYELVELVAEQDRRTRSFVVREAVREYLAAHGHIISDVPEEFHHAR